ncbi:RNA polymerase [Leptolyngbya sp. 'hensonii']|uniref:sigma-70 family RNA polymerase sigma factor n=1 Tax=Leptolyngbya sp. 'hensonii' TaxID=1922337 RepID=UPI00094FC0BA|nr:sigma-70 family RNA polymerase sigma factor [Leptolyngbya sp. 'hensonii']OLP18815.1 RNA polymerase [Leptolyngbya sp. 'hensonii']
MTAPSLPQDTILLARIAQQDQAALSDLYDRYSRILYGVAFKSLGSVEEAEEAVLDVFSQVWRTAARYDPERSRVDTWLFMITRSRILDRLRVMKRLGTKLTISVDAEQIQTAAPCVDPVEDALNLERRAQVITALKQLPAEQRQVIELAYYGGLSHSEIAQQTGMSLGTVKTRIRLGLGKLKGALSGWK